MQFEGAGADKEDPKHMVPDCEKPTPPPVQNSGNDTKTYKGMCPHTPMSASLSDGSTTEGTPSPSPSGCSMAVVQTPGIVSSDSRSLKRSVMPTENQAGIAKRVKYSSANSPWTTHTLSQE